MLKKVLIGIGALLVVLVAGVFIAINLVDWNSYKGEIAAKVREQTGRDLAIDGDISLSPFPTPTLSVKKVRFANIEGGSAPDMATLESLDVKLAFTPLDWINGSFQVERIDLVQPSILLEKLADGKTNWSFERPATAVGADAAGGSGGGPKVRLDNITISNGTLIYRDAAAHSEQKIGALNANLGANSLKGPYRADGSLDYQGVPVMFKLGAGALGGGAPAQIDAQIGLAKTDTTAKFVGTVATDAALAVNGRFDLDTANLAATLDSLAPGTSAGAPLALDKMFHVGGDLAYAGTGGEVKNFSVALGDLSATGSVKYTAGTPGKAEVKLGLNRLDLDKMLAAAQPAEGVSAPATVSQGNGGFSLPNGIDATVSLAIAAINYRGGVINDARLAAELAGGTLSVTEFSALLPGGSNIAASGTVASAAGAPQFVGQLTSKSDNLRGLLEWLQVSPGQVPGDRLRALALTTKVTASPASLKFEDFDLKLDSSSVKGGAEIALPGANRAKPAFGVGLAIDQLNLDAYMPPAAKKEGGKSAGGKGGLPLSGLAPLAGIDANVDLRVGKLTVNEQTLQSVHLDGLLKSGTLTLRELSVKEFAGGSGAVSGTVTDLAGQPRFDTKFNLSAKDAGKAFQLAGLGKPQGKLGALKLDGTLAGGARDVAYDVAFSIAGIDASGDAKGKATGIGEGFPRIDTTFDLKAKDAGPLAALAGYKAADASKLGAVALSGSATSGADDVTYDVALSLAGVGGQGKFAGKIAGLGQSPRVDTRLDFSAKKPAPLLAMLGIAGPQADKLGQVGAVGTMAGNADNMRLDLGLQGFGGSAKVAGTVMADAAPTRFDLDISADHPEFRDLLAAMVPGYRPQAASLGPFAMSAKAKGSTDAATLSGLSLRAGETSLDGTLSYKQGAARPFVTAGLRGGLVDLTPFSSPGGKGGSSGSGGGGRWSREPLDLSILETFDADVDFAADRFISGETRIDNLQAKLHVRDGTLTIEQFNGNSYGGAINLTGTLASRGVPTFKGHVIADNVDSRAVSGSRFVEGPLSFDADVTSRGYSMAELMDALDGKGRVNGTVTVLGEVEQVVGVAALSVLGQQLSKLTGVQQVQGMTDYIGAAYQAFVGRPNALDGNFIINRGVLNTNDLSFANDQARALLTGDANLSAWTIGMLVNVFSAQFPDQPCLMVDLGGILDSPTPSPRSGGGCGGGGAAAGGATPFGGLDPNQLFGKVVPGLQWPEAGSGGPLQQVLPNVLPGVLPGLNGDGTAPQEPVVPENIIPDTLNGQAPTEATPEAPITGVVPETPTPEPAPAEQPAQQQAAPAAQPEQPAEQQQTTTDKKKKKKKKDSGTEQAAPAEPQPEPAVVPEVQPAPETQPAPEAQPAPDVQPGQEQAPAEQPAEPQAEQPAAQPEQPAQDQQTTTGKKKKKKKKDSGSDQLESTPAPAPAEPAPEPAIVPEVQPTPETQPTEPAPEGQQPGAEGTGAPGTETIVPEISPQPQP